MLNYQTLVSTTHGRIEKTSYKNNKFKISGTAWDEVHELSDGFYSISYIQDYFEYIIKRNETKNDCYTSSSNICRQNSEQSYIQDQHQVLSF